MNREARDQFAESVSLPWNLNLKHVTHGQNQGEGWKQGREVGLAGVRGSDGRKMQTTVTEQ